MKTKGQKKFSSRGSVMDVRLNPLVSIEMYKAIIKRTNNISDYVRRLIMNDLNIDEYGNNRK